MKNDLNGCSTCQNGQEHYETFYSEIKRKDLVQYDYRTESGKLFSCVALSLNIAREKRDAWLSKN